MRRFGYYLPTLALLTAATVFASPPTARAGFQIEFDGPGGATSAYTFVAGNTTGAYTSNSPGPGDEKTITVSNLNVGGFKITVSIADSNSPGSPFLASITMGSLKITNATGIAGDSMLTIKLTDTGFNLPMGPFGTLTSSADFGVAPDSQAPAAAHATVVFNSYVDTTDAAFGQQQGTPTITLNNLFYKNSPHSDSDNQTATVSLPTDGSNYSVSQKTQITLANNETMFDSSTETDVTVPAPAGLVLGLAALPFIGLGWVRRRRQAAV